MESDHLFHLNYAITLLKHGKVEQAREQAQKFESLFQALDDEAKQSDEDALKQRTSLLMSLNMDPGMAPPSRPKQQQDDSQAGAGAGGSRK